MKKLFIAKNNEENFKALVLASDKGDAKRLMDEYSLDAHMSTEWDLVETTLDKIDDTSFDCDYLIQESDKYETGKEPNDVTYLDEVRDLLLSGTWEQQIHVATEADSLNVRHLVLIVEVADGVDFVQAAMAASEEYCRTEDGWNCYVGNCNCFNWGDFDAYVPNEICEKYGIRKVQGNICGELVFDQQLVDESKLLEEKELDEM